MHLIVKRSNSIFRHTARMPGTIPVPQALCCHIDLSLSPLTDKLWKRRLGRPYKRWLDQIREDNLTHLSMCGKMLSNEVILERRNSPSQQRDDDDLVQPLSSGRQLIN